MQCKWLRDGKKQCGAMAIRGGQYCFMHSPSTSKKRARARRDGGLARKQSINLSDQDIVLESPQDIQKLVQMSINAILQGKMTASNPANTIGFLSRCWLDAHQQGLISDRLNELEAVIKKGDYDHTEQAR